MTQRSLFGRDLGVQLSAVSRNQIEAYRHWREKSGVSVSTLSAELSQLRSLACQAEQTTNLTLIDLRQRPEDAVELIEVAAVGLAQSTVLTRIRAFQRFLLMGVSDYIGRQRVQAFRSAMPRKASRGWYDAGISVPGDKKRRRMPGPTPTPAALEQILTAGINRSLASGAIAALACFSGLDVKEMLDLRWRDLMWRDAMGSPYWEISVLRRSHKTTVFVMGPGAHAILRYGLSSGLQREAFVLPGRAPGTHLSETALGNDLKRSCSLAGWPTATRPQLISVFAAWLRGHGFDDHSIRLTLGRRRAASVDRLLHRQDQIDAQVLTDTARVNARVTKVNPSQSGPAATS
jgi:integrase